VLQTAVREMGRALGLPRVEVRLGRASTQSGNGEEPVDGGRAQGLPEEDGHARLD
jgi:hypothetical protein